MERAVATELRRLQVLGVPLEGTQKKRWLLMIDPAEVRAMPANLGAQARAQWLARSIRTPEQVEALNLHRFQLQVSQASGVVRGSVPFAFGILGVVANMVALNSLLEDEAKAMQHSQSETVRRIYAQGAQVIGAAAGVIELGLKKIPSTGIKFGQGIAMTGRLFRLVGRGFGVGGSLFMAVWDFGRAYSEFQEANTPGMAAYLVSGLLGGAATILLAIGWTGWGLIIVAAMIAWAFIMPLLVDNKLQDWLERCLWGKLVGQRYGDLDIEMKELKAALQA